MVFEYERDQRWSFVGAYDKEEGLSLEGDVLTLYLMTRPSYDMMAGRALAFQKVEQPRNGFSRRWGSNLNVI